MLNITLKDGVIKEVEAGTSVADLAKSLGAGLYKAACAARVDGVVCDLRTTLEKDCQVDILTFDDTEGKKAFWHTTSHVLAQAVKRLFPQAKFAIGPAIDNGFYYDFDVEKAFSTEDLEKITAEMKKIVKEGFEVKRFLLPPDEAVKLLQEMDEPYKVELCQEHTDKGEPISFYQQGEFTDLCAGPHLMSVAGIKAIKLTACTGAYWRGDSKNTQLCYCRRVPEWYSFCSAGLRMWSRPKAVSSPRHRCLPRENCIKFPVTGITISMVCLSWVIRMMKQRNVSPCVR